MDDYRPLGPDSYRPIFFKNQRATVSNSRLRLVKNCFDFPNPTSEVSQTLLALIPKSHEPFLISQLRPVALCNVSYKIVTEVISQRQWRISIGT